MTECVTKYSLLNNICKMRNICGNCWIQVLKIESKKISICMLKVHESNRTRTKSSVITSTKRKKEKVFYVLLREYWEFIGCNFGCVLSCVLTCILTRDRPKTKEMCDKGKNTFYWYFCRFVWGKGQSGDRGGILP